MTKNKETLDSFIQQLQERLPDISVGAEIDIMTKPNYIAKIFGSSDGLIYQFYISMEALNLCDRESLLGMCAMRMEKYL